MTGKLYTYINLRSIIFGVLASAMFLSLAYSLSLQYGHAGSPIATTAQDVKPVQVGQSAPRFMVKTVDNETLDFDPRTLERPAMLITFRGGWCPYCNMHLAELRNVIPEINELGVDVLFLSGDRPELLYESLNRETQETIDGLGYQILSDADANAAIALGIAFRASQATIDGRLKKGQDIEGSSMTRHQVLPVPSIFAIDADGMIAFSYVNADYKVRLPADDVLQAARNIAP